MQYNEEQSHEMRNKPTADDVAGEMSAPPRRAAIWGPRGETTPMTDSQIADRELRRLPLAQVDPDPNQPRSYFSPQGLEELKQSIQARGQLNPAFVRPHPSANGRYMLIAGERRYRVLTDLGRETITAIVFNVDEKEAREIALVDNLQRADLSAFEEAAGYQRLMEEFGYTQEQVAQTVGKDQTVISNALRINTLPKAIRSDELAKQASKSVLLELARMDDEGKQKQLWKDLKKDIRAGVPLSVRRVRELRTGNKGAEPEATAPVADKLVLAGKNLARQLEGLTAETLAESQERQDMLLGVKRRLDELFAALPSHKQPPAEEYHEEATA